MGLVHVVKNSVNTVGVISTTVKVVSM